MKTSRDREHESWESSRLVQLEVAPKVIEDLDRIAAHLLKHAVYDVIERIAEIVNAFEVLRSNPLIGRPQPNGKRELIIGRRSRGYVALYRYVETINTIFILAARGQKESGYTIE